jgi:hypothetical protein
MVSRRNFLTGMLKDTKTETGSNKKSTGLDLTTPISRSEFLEISGGIIGANIVSNLIMNTTNFDVKEIIETNKLPKIKAAGKELKEQIEKIPEYGVPAKQLHAPRIIEKTSYDNIGEKHQIFAKSGTKFSIADSGAKDKDKVRVSITDQTNHETRIQNIELKPKGEKLDIKYPNKQYSYEPSHTELIVTSTGNGEVSSHNTVGIKVSGLLSGDSTHAEVVDNPLVTNIYSEIGGDYTDFIEYLSKTGQIKKYKEKKSALENLPNKYPLTADKYSIISNHSAKYRSEEINSIMSTDAWLKFNGEAAIMTKEINNRLLKLKIALDKDSKNYVLDSGKNIIELKHIKILTPEMSSLLVEVKKFARSSSLSNLPRIGYNQSIKVGSEYKRHEDIFECNTRYQENEGDLIYSSKYGYGKCKSTDDLISFANETYSFEITKKPNGINVTQTNRKTKNKKTFSSSKNFKDINLIDLFEGNLK